MEAYPSFLTILEADTRRLKGSFLRTALGRALPFALVITANVGLLGFLQPFALAETETVMYLLLILTTQAAVIRSCVPFTRLRSFLCVTMTAGTYAGLLLLPSLFRMAPLTPAMIAVILLLAAAGGAFLYLLYRLPAARGAEEAV